MPALATIPSKTSITIDGETKNQIYTISFHKSSASKNNNGKIPTQGGKLCPRKSKKVKEDSHKNRIPTLTTNIKGSNNYFSLTSLNIYQWNQFLNKKT